MEHSLAMTEERLIALAAAGDADAFDALLRTRLDRLYVTANRILRDAASAEDAVQTAMVLAWRDLHSLRDRERFDAWLYRLLVRTCYRELRINRRWTTNVAEVDDGRTPDSILAVHDRDILERAFRALTPDKRAVIVLHHVTGLALTEIAVALEIPEGTVRSRLHYGLQELRRALAPAGALDPVEETA